VDLHQVAKGPRILGHEDIRSGEEIEGPQRDVAGRSDRRREKVKTRWNGAQVGPMGGLGGIGRVPHKFTSLFEPTTLTENRESAAE
jgi:hypothetical protein